MSNAIIKANKGKGLYSVEVEYDHGAIDARLAQLNAGVESLDEQITDLNERKAEAEATEAEAEQALKDAFAAYEAAKATMEADKAAAIAASGDTLAQDIAKARGAHDATVDRVDDRVADAADVRQDKVAAANDAYAQAEIDHQAGLDQAQSDYYDCVGGGTDPAVCYDRKQEEVDRLDESLVEAAQTRDDAIAAANDEYDDVYRQGQKDIEASENALDNAIAVAEAANEQRIADIEGDFTPLEAPAKAVSDANTALIKDRFPVQRLESQLAELELRKLSLQQQIDLLSGARKERVIDAWCADYTVGLQDGDEAGLIWPNVDANAQPILLPGGVPAAEGVVKSELAMGPASSYFNRAIMPIIQRMKPRHMIGSVTAVNDGGTLNVELRGHLSKFGRVDTVINPTLSSVPVEYMRYGAAAFEDGDDVVVTFGGLDQTEPKVIGFEHDPRVLTGFKFTTAETIQHTKISEDALVDSEQYQYEADYHVWYGSNGWITHTKGFDYYDSRPNYYNLPSYFYAFRNIGAARQSIYAPAGSHVIGAAVCDDHFIVASRENPYIVFYKRPASGGSWTTVDKVDIGGGYKTWPVLFDSEGVFGYFRYGTFNGDSYTEIALPSKDASSLGLEWHRVTDPTSTATEINAPLPDGSVNSIRMYSSGGELRVCRHYPWDEYNKTSDTCDTLEYSIVVNGSTVIKTGPTAINASCVPVMGGIPPRIVKYEAVGGATAVYSGMGIMLSPRSLTFTSVTQEAIYEYAIDSPTRKVSGGYDTTLHSNGREIKIGKFSASLNFSQSVVRHIEHNGEVIEVCVVRYSNSNGVTGKIVVATNISNNSSVNLDNIDGVEALI